MKCRKVEMQKTARKGKIMFFFGIPKKTYLTRNIYSKLWLNTNHYAVSIKSRALDLKLGFFGSQVPPLYWRYYSLDGEGVTGANGSLLLGSKTLYLLLNVQKPPGLYSSLIFRRFLAHFSSGICFFRRLPSWIFKTDFMASLVPKICVRRLNFSYPKLCSKTTCSSVPDVRGMHINQNKLWIIWII